MTNEDKNVKMRKRLRDNAVYLISGGIIIVCCIGLLIAGKILHPTAVIGSSMSPTYKDGQLVQTEPYTGQELQIGDVVVVNTDDGKTLIKRIVGLPGDTILISEGILIRNGVPQKEEYPPMENAGIASDPLVVPEGKIFVLGDNRNHSSDSREYGCLSTSHVISIVRKIIF